MKAQLNKVIVKVHKTESLLGNTETEASARGTVISKGPTNKCDIKEGDTILFSGFAGVRFKEDNKDKDDHLVLQEAEVLAKM